MADVQGISSVCRQRFLMRKKDEGWRNIWTLYDGNVKKGKSN